MSSLVSFPISNMKLELVHCCWPKKNYQAFVCWVIYVFHVEWKIGFYHKYFYLLKKHTIKVNNKNETEHSNAEADTWIGFFYFIWHIIFMCNIIQHKIRSLHCSVFIILFFHSQLIFHFIPGGILLLLFSSRNKIILLPKYTKKEF